MGTDTFVPHPAAARGELQKIRAWISHTHDVIDVLDDQDRSCLHIGVINDQMGVVKFLLKKGSNPNLLDKNGFTPLHYACSSHNWKIVELVLSFKASASILTPNGSSPINFVVAKPSNDILDQNKTILNLLKAGAPINAKDSKGQTALHLACIHSQSSVVRTLLSQNADPDSETKAGERAVHFVALKGREDVFVQLHHASANIIARTLSGETPLSIALEHQKQLVPMIRDCIAKQIPWKILETKGKWPLPRCNYSASVYNNRLYIFGGENDFLASSTLFSDLAFFNGGTFEWQCLTSRGDPPPPICRHTSVVLDSKLYLFGGFDTVQYFNDIWVLDIEVMLWSKLDTPSKCSILPRAGHTATKLSDTQFLVFGGFADGVCFNDVFIFDCPSNKWSLLDCSASSAFPAPRQFHTCSIIGKKLYLYGGISADERLCDDIWALDIDSGEWSSVPTSGEKPSGRYGHSSIVVSNRLVLVYGGCDTSSCPSSDLFAFDTHTSEWILYNTFSTETKQPFLRMGHTMNLLNCGIVSFGGNPMFAMHQLLPEILDSQIIGEDELPLSKSPRARSVSHDIPSSSIQKKRTDTINTEVLGELQKNIADLKKVLQEQMGFSEQSPVLQKCLRIEELSGQLVQKPGPVATGSKVVVTRTRKKSATVSSLTTPYASPGVPPKPVNPFTKKESQSATTPTPSPGIPPKPSAERPLSLSANSPTVPRKPTLPEKPSGSGSRRGPQLLAPAIAATTPVLERKDTPPPLLAKPVAPEKERRAQLHQVIAIQNEIENSPKGTNPVRYYKKLMKRISMPSELSASFVEKKQKSYAEVLNEILSTEFNYLRSLAIIIGIYKKPLEKERSGIVIDHYMPLLFANVEEIFELNLIFYTKLNVFEEGHLPSICDAFECIVGDIGMYNAYCTNQNNAFEAVSKLQNNEEFIAFCAEAKQLEVSRQEDFASYLAKPFQRITRYPLLLSQLIKYTNKTTPDYARSIIIKEKIDAVVLQANEAQRLIDSVVKMIEVQASFTWQGDEGQIKFSKDCKYILEGKFKELDLKSQKTSKRHFFLFSDMIVIAKQSGKKFKKQEVVPLGSCLIWDIKQDAPELSKNNKYAFSLVRTDETTRLVMCAGSEMEKTHWISAINGAISTFLTPEVSWK